MQQILTQEIVEKEFGSCKFSIELIDSDSSYFYSIIVNNYSIYIQDFEKSNENKNTVIASIFENKENVWLGIEFKTMVEAIKEIKKELNL